MGTFFQPTAARELASEPPRSPANSSGGPMRILLITDTDVTQRGGSERFLLHLIERLDSSRFNIDLIQLDRGPGSSSDSSLPLCAGPQPTVEYRPVGAIYSPRAWKVWWELLGRVRRGQYDIIQSQHEKADLLNAFLPRGPNRPLKISNRRDTGFQKGLALRLLFLLINHRFDRFIAPSRAILNQLEQREGVNLERTRCLPNGVDCERYRPLDESARQAGRLDHGLCPTAYLIGCVARLVPVKRHVDLIQGFAAIAERFPDAELVLVGGGPLKRELEHRVNQLGIAGQVRFFGEGRQMEQLLPLFDAFALTSWTEGLSNAILEAMACGLPIIATRVGGNPELVQAGVSGHLVAPRRPDELAEAMSHLLKHRERGRAMGQAARLRAETTFSLPGMMDSFTDFYRAECSALKT